MKNLSTREFLKTACAGAGLAAGAALVGCDPKDKKSPFDKGVTIPQTHKMIKWRFQTYAGTALAQHVCKPAIDAFNKVAGSRMHVDLYYADQLVPTSELFSALMEGSPRSSSRSSSGASPGASSRRRSARR